MVTIWATLSCGVMDLSQQADAGARQNPANEKRVDEGPEHGVSFQLKMAPRGAEPAAFDANRS